MTRTVGRAAVAALLVGVVTAASGRPAQKPDPVAAAQKDVVALAGQLGGPGADARAAAAAKAHTMDDVMTGAFKPRNKGGVGVGAKVPADLTDGVELAIIDMATKKGVPSAKVLGDHNADLVKLAQITRAVAEINGNYPPPKKPKAVPANWKAYNDEMKAGAKELQDAVEAKDEAKVRAAARKLNKSCVECHEMFR